MADAAEPGAPSSNPDAIPPASEKSISKEAQRKAPRLTALLSNPDRTLLRLNKLISSPAGLSAFLSTLNYTLYLVAFLETKSASLKARLYRLLNLNVAYASGASNVAALGSLLSSTRTTLRLFGLLPLYAGFRQLIQGPKPGQDQVLYVTALTQCTLYMTFQFLENVGLLTDNKVLPAAYTARWTRASGGKTAKIYLWSYRAWMGGVLCDFVRLAREAQLQNATRAKRSAAEVKDTDVQLADNKADSKWWSDVMIPMAWIPVAAHFSIEGGLPFFNLGIMGACGGLAGLGKTASLWAATADV